MTNPLEFRHVKLQTKRALRRSTFFTSAAGAMIAVTASFAPGGAIAGCDVDGSAAGTGVVLVPSGSRVDCTGTTNGISLSGGTDTKALTPFTLDVKPGATITAPTGFANRTTPAVRIGGGSNIGVGNGSVIEATEVGQEAIFSQGNGSLITVSPSGRITAQTEAIQGNRFSRSSGDLRIDNFGTIETIGTGQDATIRSGDNSLVRNLGIIARNTTGAPVNGADLRALTTVGIGERGRLENRKGAEINLVLRNGERAGPTVVSLETGSTFDNSGTVLLQSQGQGNAINLLGTGGITILNNPGAVIDASDGEQAIRGSGDNVTVVNGGSILAVNKNGVDGAIDIRGERLQYTQSESGVIEGNVRAKVGNRSDGSYSHPVDATLEFQGGSSANFMPDPATVEFFGFSDIVLDGAARLTLKQDFERGGPQGRGNYPSGHFRESLSFDVRDAFGEVIVDGAINDDPNGDKANVNKDGAGTLTLTGASGFTGDFLIRDGRVDIDGGRVAARTIVQSGAQIVGRGEIRNSLILETGGRIANNGDVTDVMTVNDLTAKSASQIRIDANETGGNLNADRIDVTGTASFQKSSVIDVVFKANAQLPALSGVNIVAADKGLKGFVPSVTLDPRSLPNGQIFSLDLEATNLGGTFATPGQAIPTGAGGAGLVVLKVESHNQIPVKPAQVVVINKPVTLPTTTPSTITPIQTPTGTPSLILGSGTNLTAPVVNKGKGGNNPQTGIVVSGGSAQVGGTVTPTPVNNKGKPIPAGGKTVGNTSILVSGTNGVTGSVVKVSQANAGKGGKHALIYGGTSVQIAHIPQNHGMLDLLGVSQAKTQRQVGQALTSTLPNAHERPKDKDQANLVGALYPLPLGDINSALDSIAGQNEDPTFVTVVNSRSFQEAMNNRLRDRRNGPVGLADTAVQGNPDQIEERNAWGEFVGRYSSGDYLNDADIRTWGLILGADQSLSENVIAGVALSYSGSDVDSQTGSSDSITTFEVAAYGEYATDDWFINGNAGISYSWLDMSRAANVGSSRENLTGDTNASSAYLGIEAGKTYSIGLGNIEPTIGLQYQYVDRDGYTENGSSSLTRKVSSEELNTGLGILGIRAYGDYHGSGDVLWRPDIRVAYAREIGDSDINGKAALTSAPGSTFDVFTAGPGEDIGVLGLRINGEGKRASYSVDYQLEARDNLFGQRLRAGISMQF